MKIRTIIVAASFIVTSACSSRPYINLFNDSSQSIKVVSCRTKFEIAAHQNAEFHWCGDALRVLIDKNVWEYDYSPPARDDKDTDPDYLDSGLFTETVKLKFIKTGELFAVGKHDRFDVKNTRAQPPMYPLIPKLIHYRE